MRNIFKKKIIFVNNGTAAIHTALYAAGIGKGDEVLVSPLSYHSVVNMILLMEAKPVFVDIDVNSLNIDLVKIKEKITKKTKAIIITDLFGISNDQEKLCLEAKKYNLISIEDSARSFGVNYGNKMSGTLGDIGCFSFGKNKPIDIGEAGMVLFRQGKHYKIAEKFINYGKELQDKRNLLGFNYKLSPILKKILIRKISYFNYFNKMTTFFENLTTGMVKSKLDKICKIERFKYLGKKRYLCIFVNKPNVKYLPNYFNKQYSYYRMPENPIFYESRFKKYYRKCKIAEKVYDRIFLFQINH